MTISAADRREHTRTTILQSAHDLFLKQGYHGTSMRQIAQAAHIALGGLYNHFASKEEVFEAVFLAFHPYHEILPMITDAQGTNLEQLIKDIIQRMVQVVEGRPDFMNLMFIEMVEFNSAHVRQLFAFLFPQGLEIAQQLVGPYMEQIRSIPPPMVVRTFLGLFFGYYLTERAIAPAAPADFRQNAMQYFVDIYLHGILTEKKPG
jgi:AcrR family transcriptional regulator